MTSPHPDPLRWKALAVVCAAFFMTVLDVSIVNVALPSIQTDLGISSSSLQWVVNGYTLMFGGILLLGGRERPRRAASASAAGRSRRRDPAARGRR